MQENEVSVGGCTKGKDKPWRSKGVTVLDSAEAGKVATRDNYPLAHSEDDCVQ
jgi:hypothetical protein